MDLLQYLLDENVDAFNTNRSQRSSPDLFAADLAGKNLRGVDFASANVEKADLSGADLTEANLMRARLTGIDGSDLKLCYAIGLKVKLREAWLENADLSGGDFTRADFSEAMVKGAKGEMLRFAQARLKDIEASGVKWPESDFAEATMTRADFSEADLSRSDMTETRANGADFTKARLDGIIGTGMRLAGAALTEATLVGARLDGANLSEADLTGADLTGVDLSRANLARANLTNATMIGVSLADASLDGTDLTGADLQDVDLTGLDPRAVGLSEEQIARLSTWGAGAAADLPTRVSAPRGARVGGAVAVVWKNSDEAVEDGPTTIRWAVVEKGKDPIRGVLPLDASSVLSHHVVRCKDAFELVLLQDRPGGVRVLRYALSTDGLGPVRAGPLGYGPMVVPVVEGGEQVLVFGIARRGPTIVQSEETEVSWEDDEGDAHSEIRLAPVFSQRQPTAQGFLARHHPMLTCKGDVLIPLARKRVGKPLRTPDGFTGRLAQAVPVEDSVMAFWVEAGRKGGLRFAHLTPRGPAETMPLTINPAVMALDAVAVGEDGVRLVWLESDPKNPLSVGAFTIELPAGKIKPVKLPEEPDSVRLAPGDGDPALLVSTFDQGVLVVDLDGTLLGEIRPEPEEA